MGNLTLLFRRIWNALLGHSDKLVESFETSDSKLKTFMEQLQNEVENQQSAVARAITSEKKLKLQIEQYLTQSKEWEKRAVLALENNNENLAKEALLKKQESEDNAINLKKEWEVLKSTSEQLKGNLKQTVERVEKAKREYEVLLAQYQSAKSQQAVSKSLTSSDSNSTLRLVDDLKNKVMNIQAQTEAQMEISGHNASSDLEKQFADLEKEQKGQVLLNEMKNRLAKQNQLPSSGNTNDVIDVSKKRISNG